MTTESRAPLLLPQNRKLRHLEGLWLRNLSFAQPRVRTTDDVALNTSPSKAGALHEGPRLHHARSTESLRPKARRRASTLVQDSPFSEQKKLQAMYDSWVADAFFSLHVEDEAEPIYVSEKQERKTVSTNGVTDSVVAISNSLYPELQLPPVRLTTPRQRDYPISDRFCEDMGKTAGGNKAMDPASRGARGPPQSQLPRHAVESAPSTERAHIPPYGRILLARLAGKASKTERHAAAIDGLIQCPHEACDTRKLGPRRAPNTGAGYETNK